MRLVQALLADCTVCNRHAEQTTGVACELRTDVQLVSPIALVFDFEHFITISDILL